MIPGRYIAGISALGCLFALINLALRIGVLIGIVVIVYYTWQWLGA